MTAISSHGGKKDVRIQLGSLPNSSIKMTQPTNNVGLSGIEYGDQAPNATSTVTKPLPNRYPE